MENWGNILTGDRAAAPRYIEVKLSKFALEVLFNAKTTTWLSSYDGRNQEPETLPVKFPLLLSSGVDGIAVGLACKILPYNFVELIDACIAHYQNKRFKLYPDFASGGMADMENYNDGLRGDRVRVRARIDKLEVKLMNFGHSYALAEGETVDHTAAWDGTRQSHEDGFLLGIRSLIRLFKQLASELQLADSANS